MATQTPSLDAVITVKVNYEGVTRRAKMSLRDTAPRVLEQEVRNFLHISPQTAINIERYSDSASAYVLLEPHNTAVYKQLYRAAKAKSKLKLRVSLKSPENPAPKPTTIQEILESCPPPHVKTEPLMPVPSASAPQPKALQPETLDSIANFDFDRFLTRQPGFAICCNSCEKTTPHVHYHCSTCDDGDFDLCEDCVAKGVSCYGSDHWLIKRSKVNGQIVNSTTEKIAPKPKATEPEIKQEEPVLPFDAQSALARLQQDLAKLEIQTAARVGRLPTRTCNQCIQELPEAEFLHCENCEDYDLCRECFAKDSHGHHPQHAFAPAVADTVFNATVNAKLAPGRNKAHHAICDNCDKFITGVRHKCLDCPDWDYCAGCVKTAPRSHPGHRFVPVYETLKASYNYDSPTSQNVHIGICCDGPLCSTGKGYPSYIRGIRYKCAVCHDKDFCASCEANPFNGHNKTHPLIKFNSPVRHVSVTTHGEHANGQQMPTMGDQSGASPQQPATLKSPSALSMNAPRTVVDTQPSAPKSSLTAEFEKEKKKIEGGLNEKVSEMRATFLRDSMQDGTIVNPDQVFEQTWVLRNDGPDSWPVGSAVRFVGGDYMGRESSRSSVASKALATANVTTATTKPVVPGEEFSFTVKLRAPPRAGKCISFWRLATPSGQMFGHRLWCDIKVRVVSPPVSEVATSSPEADAELDSKPKAVDEIKKEEEVKKEPEAPQVNSSQMIFPKLEKESPEASIHQESSSAPSQAAEKLAVDEDFEDCGKETEWDGSDDDFLTDEEYDILDASDEELLEEQTKKAQS